MKCLMFVKPENTWSCFGIGKIKENRKNTFIDDRYLLYFFFENNNNIPYKVHYTMFKINVRRMERWFK